jgi:hypothetical protein
MSDKKTTETQRQTKPRNVPVRTDLKAGRVVYPQS